MGVMASHAIHSLLLLSAMYDTRPDRCIIFLSYVQSLCQNALDFICGYWSEFIGL